MFATIKSLIPEPRQADQPRRYVGKHRQPEPVPTPDSPAPESPTADRAWRLLGHGTVGDGLVSLETALIDWVHGRLDDDIALVLLEYAGPDDGETVPMPSWEVGAAGS